MALYAFMLNGVSYAAVFDQKYQTIKYVDEFGQGDIFAVKNGWIVSKNPLSCLIESEVEQHVSK